MMDRDKLDALERLAALKSSGALTEAEFEAQKSQLLETSGTTSQPSSTAGDPLEDSVEESSYAATPPSWDRPKRRASVPTAVWAVLVLLVVGAATGFYWPRADDEIYSFIVTGSANVRDAPTSDGSAVVGQLAEGDSFLGRVRGSGDEQWVEITEGPLAGGFVWEGNLVTEGPDDPLSDMPATDTLMDEIQPEDSTVRELMERHRERQSPWVRVASIAPEHEGRFSMYCEMGGMEFRGNRMTFRYPDQTSETETYREIYRSGSRYIQVVGQAYFAREFSDAGIRNLETIARGQSVPTNASVTVPRCGERSGSVSRADLFTTQGMSDPQNLTRASCADVVAARYALTCAATILNNMPNASSRTAIGQSLARAQQETEGRCSSQFRRIGSRGDAIAQQSIGRVYTTVADQAVYGGDISDAAISLCIRDVVGSMAGAGLIE